MGFKGNGYVVFDVAHDVDGMNGFLGWHGDYREEGQKKQRGGEDQKPDTMPLATYR